MFIIIKLLLLGNQTQINDSALLFNLIKNQLIKNNNISNIIYNNLSYQSQLKLKKVSINLKNELIKYKINSHSSFNENNLKQLLITNKHIPEYVKNLALEKLTEMKSSTSEYYKQSLYVQTLINFPWNTENSFFNKFDSKSTITFLDNFYNNLNQKIYGHQECKNSFRELLGKWAINSNSNGTAIGLVGPPGVGKTLIAKEIGKSLDIPFIQITLGGQNDGELLHGHGYSYSGAQPGIIIKKMSKIKNSRCIIYFDELDKASSKNNSNEIYNILIHLIDPNTNNEFQDRFFQDINFPLNKVIFMFSYNDSSLIDRILLDRIQEIKINSYSNIDKINIIKKFLFPDILTQYKININKIKYTNEDLLYLIEEYTNEAGVRDLKRQIEKIISKINIDYIYGQIISTDFINFDKNLINKYLLKPTKTIQTIHNKNLIGVINGLYATESGQGGIIPIQITHNYIGDKFILHLTGNQKKIMQESIQTAFNASTSIIKNSIIDKFKLEYPSGLHIHTPNGSTPKDGPSAGCAFSIAFISRILNIPIDKTISMTGEIDISGNITEIGGLEYKLIGAKKAGVTKIFIPYENKNDLDIIIIKYPTLKQNLDIIIVNNIKEIITHIFEKSLSNFNF